MDISIISFDSNDALQLSNLPLHHKDPFDRMIAAQAISKNYALISDDSKFKQYIVNGLNLL